MSRWTHVAGVIRIDSLFGAGVIGLTPEAKARFDLKNEDEFWRKFIEGRIEEYQPPSGSEGPLQWIIGMNPDIEKEPERGEGSINRGYVTILGDLRDFGDAEDIQSVLDWLNTVFRHPEPGEPMAGIFIIRQAVIQIEDELDENSCLVKYDEDKKAFVRLN